MQIHINGDCMSEKMPEWLADETARDSHNRALQITKKHGSLDTYLTAKISYEKGAQRAFHLLNKRLEAAEKLKEALKEMALDTNCLLTIYQVREIASKALIDFEEALK